MSAVQSTSGIPDSVLAKYPAMSPPPGFTPNFADPGIDGSNAHQTVIVASFLTALTFVIVLLRLYTRIWVTKATGWEDWTSLFAVIGALGYTGCIDYAFTHGLGYHQWNVSALQLENLIPLLRALNYLYGPFMFFAKLSICLLLLRLFNPKRSQRWLIYAAIAYNFILHGVGTIVAICLPITSEAVQQLDLYISGFNIFSDFYLLFLPIFCIWRTQMRVKQKTAISLIFMAGLLACLSSILGMVYRVKEYDSEDITWNFAAVIILAIFEIDACIMVGCFPLFKPYFREGKLFDSLGSMTSRLFSSTRSKTDSKTSNTSYVDSADKSHNSKSAAELYTSTSDTSIGKESTKSSGDSIDQRDADEIVTIRTEIHQQNLPYYKSGDAENGRGFL